MHVPVSIFRDQVRSLNSSHEYEQTVNVLFSDLDPILVMFFVQIHQSAPSLTIGFDLDPLYHVCFLTDSYDLSRYWSSRAWGENTYLFPFFSELFPRQVPFRRSDHVFDSCVEGTTAYSRGLNILYSVSLF